MPQNNDRRAYSARLRALMLTISVAGTLLSGGCGRRSPLPPPARHGAGVHVYLAPLLAEHPLYEQYARLDQEIASLRQPCSLPQPPPVFLQLGELFLPGPEPPGFPLAQFQARTEAWQLTLLPDGGPVAPPTLEPDLAAEVAWARQQADEQAAALRQQAEDRRLSELAQVRLEARRARQEAFNNAGLDAGLTEKEAQAAAAAEEQRLQTQIEAEVAAADAAARRSLQQALAQIERDRVAAITAAEARAWERMRNRLETFGKSGGETRSRLSKAMVAPGPLPPTAAEGLSWAPRLSAPPEPPWRPQVQQLLRREQQVRSAQAALLAARRAEVLREIETGTELAVRRLAGLHDVRVYLPPLDPARGADYTERWRPQLRAMFREPGE